MKTKILGMSTSEKALQEIVDSIRLEERKRILKWLDATLAASTKEDLRINLEATLRYLREEPK